MTDNDGGMGGETETAMTTADNDSLPDLTGVDLADLLALDCPVLVTALSRVIVDDDGAEAVVAGFQSAI